MHRLPLCVCLLALAGIVRAQTGKVEIDNQWVRAVRIKLGPHEKTAMHELPASVTVFLTNIDERITSAGKTHEVTHKAGEVAYAGRVQQAEENVANQPLEKIVVELKSGAKIQPRTITLDPVTLDPKHHIVLLENARVRVLRTVLEPHIKSPMHEHPPYVVVYLAELHTTMTLADGKSVDNPRKPGDVAWRDYMKHQTENLGERTAVEIQIELK